MIIIILSAVILLLICLLVFMYFNHIKTLTKLDSMLDAAIANRFCETEFSETELSKIEAKMFRYLSAGKTSLMQIETEKNMIKSLISDISHQTKTPISNILLYSQLLTESNSLSENEAALANRIEEQTEKLNFLIGALIKIPRLENGIVAVLPKKNSVKSFSRLLILGIAQ